MDHCALYRMGGAVPVCDVFFPNVSWEKLTPYVGDQFWVLAQSVVPADGSAFTIALISVSSVSVEAISTSGAARYMPYCWVARRSIRLPFESTERQTRRSLFRSCAVVTWSSKA